MKSTGMSACDSSLHTYTHAYRHVLGVHCAPLDTPPILISRSFSQVKVFRHWWFSLHMLPRSNENYQCRKTLSCEKLRVMRTGGKLSGRGRVVSSYPATSMPAQGTCLRRCRYGASPRTRRHEPVCPHATLRWANSQHVCTNVCTHVRTHVDTHVCARIRTHECAYVCTHIRTCVCACLCTCPYTCPYTCPHTCPYTCSHTYLYTCVCTHVHAHVHTHVYAHVCTNRHMSIYMPIHMSTQPAEPVQLFERWRRCLYSYMACIVMACRTCAAVRALATVSI